MVGLRIDASGEVVASEWSVTVLASVGRCRGGLLFHCWIYGILGDGPQLPMLPCGWGGSEPAHPLRDEGGVGRGGRLVIVL